MHLFHKWGKWETGQYVYSYTHFRTGITRDREVMAQERVCLKCGKKQIERFSK